MDNIHIEIDLFKVSKLKQNSKAIGVWIDTDKVVNRVIHSPSIVNSINIPTETESLKDKDCFSIIVAVIPNHIKEGDIFNPDQGIDVVEFVHEKGKKETIKMK